MTEKREINLYLQDVPEGTTRIVVKFVRETAKSIDILREEVFPFNWGWEASKR